jgi:hypothetical protein
MNIITSFPDHFVRTSDRKIMIYCTLVRNNDLSVKIKCGNCHRGNIKPVKRFKCKVCGAKYAGNSNGVYKCS